MNTDNTAGAPVNTTTDANQPADSANGNIPGQNPPPSFPTEGQSPMGAPAQAAPMGAAHSVGTAYNQPPQSFNPFDAQQQPEKKRFPTWAIVLITTGIGLFLVICCTIAIIGVVTSDEFREGFEAGYNAGFEGTSGQYGQQLDWPVDSDDTSGSRSGATASALEVQNFIDDNRDMLEEISELSLLFMGEGATADFLAADGEFIYVYTFGDEGSSGLLADTIVSELDQPSSADLYELIADDFAWEMDVDLLTVTVRYYQSDGDLIVERSFDNRDR